MEFTEGRLKGIFEIYLKPSFDQRGYFVRVFDDAIFKKAGLERHWIQENHSKSLKKDIIRGLHIQLPPFQETKLVRCIKGLIYDVFVDLRPESPTYGQWDFIELSEENHKMIFIPKGFAHGFCTLSEISEIVYKVDNFYSREFEQGIMWNDPDLKISWPTKKPFLSEKDQNNISFKEYARIISTF